MRTNRLLLAVVIATAASIVNFPAEAEAQKAQAATPIQADPSAVRSSPAFAELILRKTELESELEALIIEYTEVFPKVIALRHEVGLINKEVERVLAIKPAEAGKLTLALGKLMVKKVENETALWSLLKTYKDEHPEVKRAKRKVEIYEKAIKEILGN